MTATEEDIDHLYMSAKTRDSRCVSHKFDKHKVERETIQDYLE